MWQYEKKLQYPVNIKNCNPKAAQIIISQYGGPDGELGASLRYLSQRYAMPHPELKGLLTDIGTEELAHLEMISAMVYQLTRNLTPEEIKRSGFDTYFVDHTAGVYPIAASGTPWTATYFQSKGDVLTDLHENLAAEQKARTTYDNLLRLIDDPDVLDPLRFLREREIVHYQRFGEGLRLATDRMNARNFYAFNGSFDKNWTPRMVGPCEGDADNNGNCCNTNDNCNCRNTNDNYRTTNDNYRTTTDHSHHAKG